MVILATTNKNKVREFKNIYSHFDFDISESIEVNEDGTSFIENATIKANEYFKKNINKCVMADDSGLEILALKGFPGIFSSRFENGRGYIKTCEDILERMKDVNDRRARYQCAIVLIDERGNKYQSIGYLNGKIADSIRGNGGFGYDPIFIPDGFELTFGELGEEVKDKISHRYKAMMGLVEQLPLKFMRRHYHD